MFGCLMSQQIKLLGCRFKVPLWRRHSLEGDICTYLFFFPSITSLYEFPITCLPVIYLYFSAIFLGSRITADGDCSHEIKRHLLLGRKAITNLDSILKSRDITLPTEVCLVKAMVFPVVMYGCEWWWFSHSVVSYSW